MGQPMDNTILSPPITAGDPHHDDTVPHHDPPRPANRSLRPLARALLAVAAEIRAARREPLDADTGSLMSFGPSNGRHSARHWGASPDWMGSEPANPHVGAPAGSPVVDSDFLGRSS